MFKIKPNHVQVCVCKYECLSHCLHEHICAYLLNIAIYSMSDISGSF